MSERTRDEILEEILIRLDEIAHSMSTIADYFHEKGKMEFE